jgi:TPR repeat protein
MMRARNRGLAGILLVVGCSVAQGREGLAPPPSDGAIQRAITEAGVEAGSSICASLTASECMGVARFFRSGDTPADATKALLAYQAACAMKVSLGCRSAAIALAGHDDPGAVGFYLQACELGEANSCAWAGNYLLNGGTDGATIPKDPMRALQVYLRGCSTGDAVSCTQAAAVYDGGVPSYVKADLRRARALSRRACKLDVRDCPAGRRDPRRLQ